MSDLIMVFIDNARHAVFAIMPICPVNTGITFGTFDRQAISAILAIQADGTVLAIDDDSRTVFAIDANLAINAILAGLAFFARLTFFTDRDAVALDLLVHHDRQAAISISNNLDVISGVAAVILSAVALDGQRAAQITMYRDICIVALEIQAFRCHTCSCVFKLGNIDGIGLVCTGGYAVDLAGYLTIDGTDGYGCISGLPSRSSLC